MAVFAPSILCSISLSGEEALPPSAPTRITALTPGIAAIVASLATLFSITFFLLLYAMHCRRGLPSNDPPPMRRNSGVDRGVIESLPVFRFSAVTWRRVGVECAVCLSRFRSEELLRLLPKCKHAFHVECVDTWLDGHSTCPLCRYRVAAEDVLLVTPTTKGKMFTVPRISGRHSSAGEREKSLEIILGNDFRGRVSLDSWYYSNSRRKSRKRMDEDEDEELAVGEWSGKSVIVEKSASEIGEKMTMGTDPNL